MRADVSSWFSVGGGGLLSRYKGVLEGLFVRAVEDGGKNPLTISRSTQARPSADQTATAPGGGLPPC